MCLFLKDLFLFLFSHSNILLWNFFNTWKGIKYNENTHVQYLPEDVIQLWHIWSLSALSYPTGTSTILTFGFTFHAFLQCYRIFSIPMWHQTLIPRECSDSLGFAKGHLGAHLGKKPARLVFIEHDIFRALIVSHHLHLKLSSLSLQPYQ